MATEQSISLIQSMSWLCPFCDAGCWPGWDCECGAKAINSLLWKTAGVPDMLKGGDIQSMISKWTISVP